MKTAKNRYNITNPAVLNRKPPAKCKFRGSVVISQMRMTKIETSFHENIKLRIC